MTVDDVMQVPDDGDLFMNERPRQESPIPALVMDDPKNWLVAVEDRSRGVASETAGLAR
jgi:hypothetical protein